LWAERKPGKVIPFLYANMAKLKKKISKKTEKKEEQGLKQSWLNFIDAYIECGNATEAYMQAYPGCTRKTAGANSHVLLKNTEILQELNYRYRSQKITESGIAAELWEIGTKYRGAKTINAAVNALKTLAQTKGMLVDTRKVEFTGKNPAVFLAPYSAEEKAEFDKIRDTKQRIVE